MADNFSTKTTHDLWVDARTFELTLSRPTPTTLQLVVTHQSAMTVAEGAVVLISSRPISGSNHPADGNRYTASTDLASPADTIFGAQVVGFYSSILGVPLPSVPTSAPNRSSFSITLTNADANTIYYASVHASTNVLQYYPVGVQSYPLEGSRIEKDSSTFTGNIPSFPSAPTSPSEGMVYFDQGLNVVQYWTGSQWIPTRMDSILAGPNNPGTAGQTYFYSAGSVLKVFDGSKWVSASSANFQVQVPGAPTPTWVALGAQTSGVKLPEAPVAGDFFWNFTTQRGQYWDGVSWIYPTGANTLLNAPPLLPAFTNPLFIEGTELPNPYIGQLFYNTSTKELNVWTGAGWRQANTDQSGTPSTDKVAIGTDGSYDERVRLIKIMKGQMGWPVQCVELQEEQFNIAIDNALDTYRQLSDGAYTTKYILFTVIEGQQMYYLNSAVDGTDKIVGVSKIHRLNILGANSLNWDSNVYFQTFLNQYYSAGYTDVLSIHLVHSLSEDFQRIFAGDLTFQWDEPSRELFITRRLARTEKVIIEAHCERTEQELLVDRWCKQFIQNWALAEVKMMLGMIRSKFSSGTPGAGGPINLNGELLVSEARQDMTELKEELLNNEYGGFIGKGNVSFLIG